MALQFGNGIGTLFTLALLLCCANNGQLSVAAFSSIKDKESPLKPQISIIVHPPWQAIVTRDAPTYLPCVAKVPEDYSSVHNVTYDYSAEDDDEEEETHFDNHHQRIFSDFKPIDNNEPNMNGIDEPDESPEDTDDFENEHVLFKRNVRMQSDRKMVVVYYQWYRDGQLLDDMNESEFNVLTNGTLKILYSSRAAGHYRCLAGAVGLGRVLSTGCSVQQATLEVRKNSSNYTANFGESIVLNCQIYSVPKANITWQFSNNSNIDFSVQDRYFQLQNGSLLITSVQRVDNQKFKCLAVNNYATKTVKSRRLQLSVLDSMTPVKHHDGKLMDPLQNLSITVIQGESIRLVCALAYASPKDTIKWTFVPRSNTESIALLADRNQINIVNAVAVHDGSYHCSSSTDYQVFDVQVATPPIIQQGFTSAKHPVGFFVKLNCTLTGNPKPTVVWYRNGKLLKDGLVTMYDGQMLVINTYEERHKGIYQCFGSNIVGEAEVTGLLSWENKKIPDQPKNVECHPVNRTTILVTFDRNPNYKWDKILYFTASKTGNRWRSLTLEGNNHPIYSEFLLSKTEQPSYQVFTLYFRGMEKTGYEQSGNLMNQLFDMSILTKGRRCATQGLELHAMFFSSGIFIWWPQNPPFNVTSFTIQFWHNDTSNPTVFSEEAIGTTVPLNQYQTNENIEHHFVKIAAKTNIYPKIDSEISRQHYENGVQSMDIDVSSDPIKNIQSETITEVRVPGNVTGILVPNTKRIIVRVLIPIIYENRELDQDLRYVQWRIFEVQPNHSLPVQVFDTESRSASFHIIDKSITCIRACYKDTEQRCQEILIEKQFGVMKSLAAFTSYKVFVSDCDQGKIVYGVYNIHTRHDVPGPITDHKIVNYRGVTIKWNPPINSNGKLVKYLVEWTVNNNTHSADVSISNDKNENGYTHVFKLPFSHDEEKFNITIRAINIFGPGIPIYINLNRNEFPSELPPQNVYDASLGIIIGLVLSLFCIIACMSIIIRHQKCAKSRNQLHLNGTSNHGNHARMSSDPATTILFPTQTTNITSNNVIDLHEIQTLMSKPNDAVPVKPNKANGIIKHCDDSKNSSDVISKPKLPIGHEYSIDSSDDDSDLDNENDISRRNLISSVPKYKQSKPIADLSTELTQNQLFTEEIATTSDPCFNNTNHLPRVIYAADEKTATIDLPSVANESTDCSAQLLLENDIHEHSQNSVKPVSNNMLPPKCLPVMNENPSRAYKKTKNSQYCNGEKKKKQPSANTRNTNNTLYVNSSVDNTNVIKNNGHIKHRSPNELICDNVADSIEMNQSNLTTNRDTNNASSNNTYYQKSPQKFDYRRPIVGPNG